MPLYHVTQILLQPGSVILPGNYGRILGMYQMRDANAVLYRERFLEDIRQREFPKKPSRLSSSFCLESLQEAQFYRDNLAGRYHVIYEVELVDPGCNQHRADYNKVSPLMSEMAARMEDVARAYWMGTNIERPEIVADTALRLIQRVA
jgi:hypothetical protein